MATNIHSVNGVKTDVRLVSASVLVEQAFKMTPIYCCHLEPHPHLPLAGKGRHRSYQQVTIVCVPLLQIILSYLAFDYVYSLCVLLNLETTQTMSLNFRTPCLGGCPDGEPPENPSHLCDPYLHQADNVPIVPQDAGRSFQAGKRIK